MARRRLTRRQRERIGRIQDRRRTQLAGRSADVAEAFEKSGLGPPQAGLVIAHYGAAIAVEDDDGQLHRCAVRQNLEALAAGDRVVWQSAAEGEGVVTAVQPRRSLLARPDYSGQIKPLAANLDRVAVVVAPQPEPNEFLIDRYLVTAVAIGVEALLVVNKMDLLDAGGRTATAQRLGVYARIGYPVLFASVRSEAGLKDLRERLAGHVAILVGQSGVGKSSLVKALLPDQEIRIEALSQATGRGVHTTTTVTLYHLPHGGDLIDSPGVRSFELGDLNPEDLERGFVEFGPYRGHCRFSDCRHTVEPGCALREAVEKREIDPRRLQSYHQLREASPVG